MPHDPTHHPPRLWASLALLLSACAGTTPNSPPPETPASDMEQGPQGQATEPGGKSAGWLSTLHREHPLVGRVMDPRRGRDVEVDVLFDTLATAQVVLLGEQHDNPDHHLLQARVVRELAKKGIRPPLVFEQLEVGQQPAIDAYLKSHPGDARGLGPALAWDKSGWPPFKLYAPVFEAALAHGARIRAGSLDRSSVMAVSREGLSALDPALVQGYGLDLPLDGGTQAAMVEEMRQAHCGMLPESMLAPMVTVQRARDATMAAAVVAAGPAGAIVVAGNGHARTDRGVPHQLRKVHGLETLSVAFIEVRPGQDTLADYAKAYDGTVLPFDYVWFTPMVSDEDHCAALKARYGKHGDKPKPAP